jgi:hypothetical protein
MFSMLPNKAWIVKPVKEGTAFSSEEVTVLGQFSDDEKAKKPWSLG